MADSGPSGTNATRTSSGVDPFGAPKSFRQTAAGNSASTFDSPSPTIGTPSTPSAARMPLRTNPDASTLTPSKRMAIRADPTLVSCFDPADKELYNLWAPKQ